MADIDLQKKEQGGLGWLWALLALLLVILLVWWLWPDDGDDDFTAMDDTSVVEPMDQADAQTDVGLATIVANPSQWIGRTFPDMRVEVGDEMTDRGFFIQSGGAELMALIIDWPLERTLDINPGQTLRIIDGTLRGPDYIGSIPGDPLEADTEALLRDQGIFLVADEAHIEIVEGNMAMNMSSIDTDQNDEISENEYVTWMDNEGVFARWDTDGDGFLDESDYDAFGFANDPGYSTLDEDDDGFLDSDEFFDGVWTIHDEDESGYWDEDEWDDAGDSGLFDF